MNSPAQLPICSPTARYAREASMRRTLVGIGVNALLAIVKAATGFFGHFYALIADAIESTSDILSSLIV